MMRKLIKFVKTSSKKLQIYDWVLIFFGLVSLIVFAVIFFRKSTYITATVSLGEESVNFGSLYNSGPKNWFVNAFYVGQTEKDGLGRIQSEVLSIYSYNIVPEQKIINLKVKLNCVYNKATNTFTYKGIPVLVGSTIKLNLDKAFAEGLIIDVQDSSNPIQQETIKIETKIKEENPIYLGTDGTKDYIAEAIKVGDEVKDNNGLTLIKVISKKVEPSNIIVSASNGRAVLAKDPLKKDVTLVLEVLADKIGGKYYFLKKIPLVIDQNIPINTETLSIYPTITKFLTY